MSLTLAASLPVLQQSVQDALEECLEDAFKATFPQSTPLGDKMAKVFAVHGAAKGAPKLAQAIYNFVKEAQIITDAGMLIGTCTTTIGLGSTNTPIIPGQLHLI